MSDEDAWPAWATEEVHVASYDPSWRDRAAQVTAHVTERLAPWLRAPVEHIGSTSVPGLAAKPVVDLMAAVDDLAVAAEARAALGPDSWFLVPPELDGRPWRRFLVHVVDDRRSAHLHLLLPDSPAWRDQLAFRDRLRADAALAQAYGELKARLAAEHTSDREAYTAGKAAFVRRVLDQPPAAPTA